MVASRATHPGAAAPTAFSVSASACDGFWSSERSKNRMSVNSRDPFRIQGRHQERLLLWSDQEETRALVGMRVEAEHPFHVRAGSARHQARPGFAHALAPNVQVSSSSLVPIWSSV
jgi:hypothetical protein